jgi:hypothetical protein
MQMLDFVMENASSRKLRLFACAYCRRVAHLFPSSRGMEAIEAAEAFADGLVSAEDLRYARNAAWLSRDDAREEHHDLAAVAATHVAEPEPRVRGCVHAASAALIEGFADDARERGEQSRLLRCIFGPHPGQPLHFDRSRLTDEARTLAQRIYETKAFEAMPELAHALATADPPALLAHCQDRGPHVRGCWVIDTILDKS